MANMLSRRGVLGSAATTGLALGLPRPASAGVEPADGPTPDATAFAPDSDFLSSARRSAAWIESARVQDPRGARWRPDPDHPQLATTVSPENTLYAGSAGTVLFFLQMAQATGAPAYRETAVEGARYLAASWRDLVDKPSPSLPPAPGFNLTLYNGLSGLAFVLLETWKATGTASFEDEAVAAADHIANAAVSRR